MSHAADINSYISARDAALKVRLHPDYVARLARQARIRGKKVGRRWYVDPISLQKFLSTQSLQKEERRVQLKTARRKEYVARGGEASPIATIEDVITENVNPHTHRAVTTGVQHAALFSTPGVNMHAISYAIHPGADFLHRLVALITSFVIVFGSYSLIDREFGRIMFAGIAYSSSAIASLAAVLAGAYPDCTSPTERMAASAHVAFENTLISLENFMPSGLAPKTIALGHHCSQ